MACLFVQSLCERRWELQMSIIYIIGAIVAFALLIYLFVALLKPELFS
jgi:K+-transporting ATPase KdpF subunit